MSVPRNRHNLLRDVVGAHIVNYGTLNDDDT